MPQLDIILTLMNFLLAWLALALLSQKTLQLLTHKELKKSTRNLNLNPTPTWTLPWT
uniref:ATP synthase complex subunit 8 n=1 Tax=Achalinus spinalis TaxID=1748395 RepID=A0A1I9KE90_9SAUR|nr:ATP synthase F0 subunit 8 [Achalinus spinalis]ALM54910.1 ATPase subunit 8 [Achalinus spinalis]